MGSPKGSPRVQNEAWGRLWGGFGKALGGFGKALGRLWEALGALGKATARPPDRTTAYIYKLPINRSSGPILVVVVVVVVR